MAWKQLGLIAIGFAAGLLVASQLVSSKLNAPVSGKSGALIKGEVSVERIRADYERQISDLRRQVQSLQLQTSSMPGLAAPTASAIDERARLYEELRKLSVEDYKKEISNRLHAAGYTTERIEWISKRSEELEADWIRTEDRIKQQGTMSAEQFAASLAHQMDKDIGLRQEMGDEEYAKYRQATGRGLGLAVSESVRGGIGERAGIKSGDQIIAYNGVRVFNQGELLPLMQKYSKSGTSIAVDVVRNGQTIRLNAEGGDLRITPASPRMSALEMVSRQ